MKSLVIIVTALLSFIFGGERASDVRNIDINCIDTVIQSSDTDAADKKADFNDPAILPVRTASYFCGWNSFSPSLRSTNSGKRVQPSTKSAYRIIRAGKVIDRNNFNTFRAVILQFLSGIRSNSRYIYSICQLLI